MQLYAKFIRFYKRRIGIIYCVLFIELDLLLCFILLADLIGVLIFNTLLLGQYV